MRSKYIPLWKAEFEAHCAREGIALPPDFKADGAWYPLDGGCGRGVRLRLDDPDSEPFGQIERGVLHYDVWRPRCRNLSGLIDTLQVLAAYGRSFRTRPYCSDHSDPPVIAGLDLARGEQHLPAQIIDISIRSLQFAKLVPRELRLDLQSSAGRFHVDLAMLCSEAMPPGCSRLQSGALVGLELKVLKGGTAKLRRISDQSRFSEAY